ncbi:2-hydroxy-3-oxopropionate reductase [Laceyella sacchari]|jgi:3-hydroxyisobutyrate dehydrogenase|uniref:3-hydroxyisobutyrate dehydrogenase n=1 Tax=Laceyella tengchongensis TaxID=574699 RepID=A0AA45WS84_9BACL|nr:NAD(P)-dependent oxidoreductase [Laceyella tengchongensis]AUS07697.1 2-hydroxy-3-oxopropionate reductase [Laceyella sacchari]SMP34934.1 3-hydroxyisobutyrate dehydrogenase [Laceyella tengchongensis]
MEGLKIGFIGLGIMGKSMARNLHRAGFEVTVWNRTAAKMDEAKAEWGAHLADSPKDVAAQSDVVITMVGDTPDVREVVTGEEGVLAGARPGTVLIDMSTISPEATRELAELAAEQGVAMLDAPVSGGDVGARNGTLSIMVGGEEKVLEKVRPVLEAMGKTIVHCGPIGAGQTVKACNQILCGLNLLGMVEALAFAKKSGVDLEKMIQVTSQGAGGSWALANYGPRVVKGDLDPGFSVRFQQKDLRIVLAEAERMELPLLGTATVQQLLRAVQAHGGNEDGTQALVRVMEQLGNVEITPKQ